MINMDELKAPENRGVLSISVTRILVGLFFVLPGLGKIMRDGGFNPMGFLNSREQMPDWYRSFVDSIVAPAPELFGILVGYGELFLAISLILGIMVRPACLLGAFMIANFMAAKGTSIIAANGTLHDTLFLVILLILYFNDAGKFLGLENWFREKFPKIPS